MPNHPHRAVTPWNPSRRATERVKNPLPAPCICPYCGSGVELVSNREIYGREFGDWPWVYKCTNALLRDCDAYVGLHPFTSIPLGTLANKELRKARQECKVPFNLLWQSKRMTRTEAYAELAQHMGKTADECHYGMFNLGECRSAYDWAVKFITTTTPPKEKQKNGSK